MREAYPVNASLSLTALWTAAATALLAFGLAGGRLARRFPAIPSRVPLRLRLDGRPRNLGPKAALWAAPAIALAITLGLIGAAALSPPPEGRRLPLTLAFLACAQAAWCIAWVTDRLIEIARGMTVRIAPQRILGLILPIVATLLIATAAAIAESL